MQHCCADPKNNGGEAVCYGVIDTGSHAATLGQEIESQSSDSEEEN